MDNKFKIYSDCRQTPKLECCLQSDDSKMNRINQL